MLKKIREVIVVEGKNDSKKLKSFFDVDTIETHGLGLNNDTIGFIKEINKTRGVILLLDPDNPGELIRRRLNEAIPNLKNAFIFKEDARTKRKVGVEHASKEVLEDALNNFFTYIDSKNTITMSDLIDLGFMGNENSDIKRLTIAKKYHFGKCNAKTFLNRLNMLGLSKNDIIDK